MIWAREYGGCAEAVKWKIRLGEEEIRTTTDANRRHFFRGADVEMSANLSFSNREMGFPRLGEPEPQVSGGNSAYILSALE